LFSYRVCGKFMNHNNELYGERMIHIKDHNTHDMFDSFAFLGPKCKKFIEKSWGKLFREQILSELPLHKIVAKYDQLNGRPTKELCAMLGVMILQQMFDLTDEEAINQFAFNIEWHYALNIICDSDWETKIYLLPYSIASTVRSATSGNYLDSKLA
jgi:hypothetical protein